MSQSSARNSKKKHKSSDGGNLSVSNFGKEYNEVSRNPRLDLCQFCCGKNESKTISIVEGKIRLGCTVPLTQICQRFLISTHF
ncbi:hypothetical protein L6164_028349 [Bauhinia variegata]|uniref:Uncharacterized protein n=1 Tax=Bauhinia variegata TaxID=167791 RepID=A0ACB9LW25_BAUVA|nr:hypothetical protein L6164_028349 [Bauhinia variegata]